MNATEELGRIWRLAGLPPEALAFANLSGTDPVLPSSFAVGTAAQSTIAAAALAACELGHVRGVPRQEVGVEMLHAALECTGWFSVDGRVPDLWDPFSGLYRAADGWVRIHANFAHHRDGALRLLGLDPQTAQRTDAEAAMQLWKAIEFESAAAAKGLVATAMRSFDEWDVTPQGEALVQQPLFTIERIGDAPPLDLPPLSEEEKPLSGVRVLDLTRILAGPVGGRALAAYGADVMLINSPNLPNIEAIADTSRGKLSAHVDLQTEAGRDALTTLLQGAHVFVQGYRPGGIAALGFGANRASEIRPGIVYVSLTAYGTLGPWAQRRGFDSLVQTAMGFNHAEGEAAGDGKPRPLPMQILDEATGYLIAMGASAALWRQQREGGSWHVQVSLAQTGRWLRGLGRVADGLLIDRADRAPYLETSDSGFGVLCGMRHSALLSRTPAGWGRPSVVPGSHLPVWP
ncbi:CoA transferase [Variovorax sp. GT1P44]|uniref:CoA transferase n=1 Tax=Variovorax sp. GT1P44 TaxID=3443742 RepID=UPI003F4606AC